MRWSAIGCCLWVALLLFSGISIYVFSPCLCIIWVKVCGLSASFMQPAFIMQPGLGQVAFGRTLCHTILLGSVCCAVMWCYHTLCRNCSMVYTDTLCGFPLCYWSIYTPLSLYCHALFAITCMQWYFVPWSKTRWRYTVALVEHCYQLCSNMPCLQY